MRWQLGQFFALLGFLALIIFMMTYWVNSPSYVYFCSGGFSLLLGVSMMWLGRKPPDAADRFRSYRSLRRRREERREARARKAETKEEDRLQ